MKAAVLNAFRKPLTIECVREPECPPDGVIVQVHACGVCRSDLHTWNGADSQLALPHVMGHEFAGTVVEAGPECRKYSVGDRVTAPFILGCGNCEDCAAGQPTICETQRVIGFTQWGAFAERVPVQRADFNLVRLPDSLTFTEAAGMGCRITTAWRALSDRAGLREGEWLAVHGCGGVGLSAIMLARTVGARIVAVDVSERALVNAKQLGADHCLNPSDVDDVGEAIRALTGGGAHVSLDALGISTTFRNSVRSLRKLGRHVQVGFPTGADADVSLPLADLVYSRQLSLFGMRGLGAAGFASLLQMAEERRIDLSRLVTETIALEELQGVLDRMESGSSSGVTVIDRFQ